MARPSDTAHFKEQLVPLGFAGARVLVEHGVTQVGLILTTHAWQLQHEPRDHWILYALNGESRIKSKSGELKFSTGQVWLIPAGCSIEWRCDNDLWTGFRVALSPEGRWSHLAGNEPREIPAGQAHRIFYCVEGLFHEAHGPHYPDHALIGSHFAGALAIFLDRRLEATTPAGFWVRSLHELWSRVASDLGAEWSVRRLASSLGVSTPHFHRLCIAHYGSSPHRILLRMRMEAAYSYLLEGRVTLDRIATLTGYADSFALSKAFKRHFGRAPAHITGRRGA